MIEHTPNRPTPAKAGALLAGLPACCSSSAVRAAVSAVPDWPALIERADQHGLGPLLFETFSAASPDLVPPAVLADLRQRFAANLQRNLCFAANLIRLLELLEAGGVECLVFKGPVSAWLFYANPALRVMSDLDLLVHSADARRATDLLLGMGYAPDTEIRDPRFYRYVSEIHFSRPGSANIDLHWRLAPPHFDSWFDIDALFRNAQTVQIGGHPVRTFCPQDLLVYLCMHSAKHGWSSLVGIADLARLIGRCPIDWDQLLAEASRKGYRRTLGLGLLLVHELAGSPLPPSAMATIESDSRVRKLAGIARERLLDPAGQQFDVLDAPGWQWILLERPSDRLRLLWGLMQPNIADWQHFRLPPACWPFYFLLRPLRLLARYARKARRMLNPLRQMQAPGTHA